MIVLWRRPRLHGRARVRLRELLNAPGRLERAEPDAERAARWQTLNGHFRRKRESAYPGITVRMKGAAASVASIAALLGASCGSNGGEAVWGGPPPPSAQGEIDVSSFNDFLVEEQRAFERSPALIAAEFLRLDLPDVPPNISIESHGRAEPGAPATVVVRSDLPPGMSIRSIRETIRLKRQADGTWRLRSARRLVRCWPGQGHQEFSPDPCG